MFDVCSDDYGNPYVFDDGMSVCDYDAVNDDELIVETLWEIRS